MNRLLPGAMSMAAMPEPAPMASQSALAPSYAPGQKAHLRAIAKMAEVPIRGNKEEIVARITSKLSESVGRRVRAPKAATEAQTTPEAAPAIDPFDEALGRFEAFLRAR